MKKKINDFLDLLSSYQSSEILFNQYCGDCPEKDFPGVHKDRVKNLKIYLEFFAKIKPKIMIVGESAGYNGAKINGLHLIGTEAAMNLGIRGLKEIIHAEILPSRTEEILWDFLNKYKLVPLTFNIVPYFTKINDCWTKNRAPSKIEIETHSIFSKQLYEMLRPEIVLAMGRKAEYGLNFQNIPNQYVRHPSMGGKKEFGSQLSSIATGLG